MAAKYELKQGNSGKFMFNLKAGNGQVILTSQSYADKSGAQKGIESVRAHAADDACYERKTASSGEPFFTLKSTNGQVIGKSEMYSGTAAMENGIASVKTNGPEAALDDQTG